MQRTHMAVFAAMTQASWATCTLLIVACSDHSYVIGRYQTGADGGTGSDAAGEDAGMDECAGTYSEAILCSGFEQPLREEWPDRVETGSAQVQRFTDQAHSGTASLQAVSSGPKSRAVVVDNFAPLREGELNLRAYVFVPAEVPTEIMNIFFVGDDAASNETFEGVDFNLAANGVVQIFMPLHEDPRRDGTLTIPRDQWFCFQARILLDNDDGAVQAFVNGAPAVELLDVDTVPEGGVRQFRTGIDWSSEQEAPFEILIDDVVLDTAQVACR